jgi:pyruvate formate lyase activating enzyme
MGKIHSIESFGTVDGPGVRFVVFFQGCPMRCLYCHNPDTWSLEDGCDMSVKDILAQMERNRSFYKTGGLTATGGEPMMQIDFLTELFAGAKERGIHTCLDTSGVMFPQAGEAVSPVQENCGKPVQPNRIQTAEISMQKISRLMQVTDLIMLDIKHIDTEGHRALTGHGNERTLAFARYLSNIGKPVWIRHVVVPGITYDKEELTNLGKFLKTLTNLEKLEVLPYHSLGKVKYDNLGIDYVLKNTPQLTKQEAAEAEALIRDAMKKE